MGKCSDIISIAQSYIGTIENYNNDVIFNTKYYGRKVSGEQYPWCCVFVWYVFNEANASKLFYDGKKTALCQTAAEWFKKQKQWYTTPEIGDCVFFKFGKSSRYTDHIGIVKDIKPDGSIVTIEGNTSDKNNRNGGMVLERVRKSGIVGYGRPQYKNDDAQIKPQKIKYPLRGIDVSTYQKNLDYQKLKDNGVQFAIIKVTNKKNQPDEGFERHYKGFTEVGVPVQFYHYSYSETVESANIAAMAVIKALNGRKGIFWLDVENKCLQNKKERLIDIINTYQEKIEAAGLIFGIYSGLSFVKSYIVPYIEKLKCRNLWCARYYNGYNEMRINSQLNESKKPNIPGFNLVAWQYTSSGVIEGSSGRLDCNILYEELGNNPSQKVEEVPQIKVGYVNTHSLKVRNKPDTTGKVLGYLMEGEKVFIYETDSNTGWYRIHPQPNDPHWVSNKYIDVQK